MYRMWPIEGSSGRNDRSSRTRPALATGPGRDILGDYSNRSKGSPR